MVEIGKQLPTKKPISMGLHDVPHSRSDPRIPRPRRWDRPFSNNISDTEAELIALTIPPFASIDASTLKEPLSLKNILKNDCSIRAFRPSEVVAQKGTYGNSVFVILKGRVREINKDISILDESVKNKHRTFATLLKRLFEFFRFKNIREYRDISIYFEKFQNAKYSNDNHPRYAADPEIIKEGELLEDHDMFGHIAALSRSPYPSNFVSETATEVLEIRWQGLRDVARQSKFLKSFLEAAYRTTGLLAHLRQSHLLSSLTDQELWQITECSELHTYGSIDWAYQLKINKKYRKKLSNFENAIVMEGDYLDTIYFIINGFCRITKNLDTGDETVNYLMPGEFFGVDELYDHIMIGSSLTYRNSLFPLSCVDIIAIPRSIAEDLAIPRQTKNSLPPRRR